MTDRPVRGTCVDPEFCQTGGPCGVALAHATGTRELVFVAVMENDIADVCRRLRAFLPGELNEFERQVEMLVDCIRDERRRQLQSGARSTAR